MSRLRSDVPTAIVAVPFRDAPIWGAHGNDRAGAEAAFACAVLHGDQAPPAYRVVIQLKVNQHAPELLSSTVH